MALSTYAELKTGIANWLNRSDLTDEISDDFIKLTEADFNAKSVIQSAFPDRKIVAINGIDILMGGGNIHCITQQQPKSKK